MKIALFGATGGLGTACLEQALEAGHEITLLVRDASKLPNDSANRVTVVEGDGLNADDVGAVLGNGVEAVCRVRQTGAKGGGQARG